MYWHIITINWNSYEYIETCSVSVNYHYLLSVHLRCTTSEHDPDSHTRPKDKALSSPRTRKVVFFSFVVWGDSFVFPLSFTHLFEVCDLSDLGHTLRPTLELLEINVVLVSNRSLPPLLRGLDSHSDQIPFRNTQGPSKSKSLNMSKSPQIHLLNRSN